MTRPRPLRIGLSARLMHQPPTELGFGDKTLQYLEQSVAHWIMSQGALVFMVPTLESAADVRRSAVHVSDYVREIDALVLQGGADVSPTSYGEEPLHPDWAGDRVRDLYEIELLWECIIQGRPVLGVCRGAQLINVAFGGTLYQDIATQISDAALHVDRAVYDQLAHDIEIEPGSELARLYPETTGARVTSIHHQCVNRLGSGLVVEARSPADGVIEAIRYTGAGDVMGVQWHPEFHTHRERLLLDSGPLLVDFLRRAEGRRH